MNNRHIIAFTIGLLELAIAVNVAIIVLLVLAYLEII